MKVPFVIPITLGSVVIAPAIWAALIGAMAIEPKTRENLPNKMLLKVRAAAKEAKAGAAGDPVKFTAAYRAALHRIAERDLTTGFDETEGSAGGRRGVAPTEHAFPPDSVALTNSIYDDSTFIKNEMEGADWEIKIVGGEETEEFMDCVAVGGSDGYCCSGTLITPNVVLTAAHCLDTQCGPVTKVFLGSDVSKSGKIVKVHEGGVIRHPDYVAKNHANDIAILILEEQVANVSWRRMASAKLIDEAKHIQVAGFGYDDVAASTGRGVKRFAQNISIASNSCSRITDPYTYDCKMDKEIVAADALRDTCRGDSGGPAYVLNGNEHRLGAVTSRATPPATPKLRVCGDGGIYVRVDRYFDWIRQTILSNGGTWPVIYDNQ